MFINIIWVKTLFENFMINSSSVCDSVWCVRKLCPKATFKKFLSNCSIYLQSMEFNHHPTNGICMQNPHKRSDINSNTTVNLLHFTTLSVISEFTSIIHHSDITTLIAMN